MRHKDLKIAVIGLGYAGLPLAVEFGKRRPVIGFDIVTELKAKNCAVDVYDPWVDEREVAREFGFSTVSELTEGHYDGIVIAVAHDEFKNMGADRIHSLGKASSVVYDLKYVLTQDQSDLRL
jgi:UDP-N-acetyl-D-galactosamine dehydrogenase